MASSSTIEGSLPARGLAMKGLLRPGFWAFVAALVALDLWSKGAVFAHVHAQVASGGPAVVPVLGDWLAMRTVHNSGGIFGIGQGYTWPLTIVRTIAVFFLIYLVGKQDGSNRLGLFTLGLLCAGAAGNLCDNLEPIAPWTTGADGAVRDWIQVDFGFWPFDPWPIFNVADSCISIGFVLLITGLARIRLFQDAD